MELQETPGPESYVIGAVQRGRCARPWNSSAPRRGGRVGSKSRTPGSGRAVIRGQGNGQEFSSASLFVTEERGTADHQRGPGRQKKDVFTFESVGKLSEFAAWEMSTGDASGRHSFGQKAMSEWETGFWAVLLNLPLPLAG